MSGRCCFSRLSHSLHYSQRIAISVLLFIFFFCFSGNRTIGPKPRISTCGLERSRAGAETFSSMYLHRVPSSPLRACPASPISTTGCIAVQHCHFNIVISRVDRTAGQNRCAASVIRARGRARMLITLAYRDVCRSAETPRNIYILAVIFNAVEIDLTRTNATRYSPTREVLRFLRGNSAVSLNLADSELLFVRYISTALESL